MGMPQRTVMINFRGSVGGLMTSTKAINSMITGIAAKVVGIGVALVSALGGNFKPIIGTVLGAITSFAKILLIIPSFLIALVNPFSVATMAMANFSTAISASTPAQFVASTRNMAPAMKDAVMSVRLLTPQLKNLYGIIQQGFWLGFSQDVDDLARVYFPVLGNGLGKIGSALGALRERLVQLLLKPEVVAAINSWMDAFGNFMLSLGPFVEHMLPTLISLFTSFSQILINFLIPALTWVADLLARVMTWIAPILSGIGAILAGTHAIAGTTGSTTGTTGGGGFFSTLWHGVTSFFSGLFGRASGGPVLGGQSYLVGERGPEILSMGGNAAGTVSPNAGVGPTYVTVKIGETELREIVATEIHRMVSEAAVGARMGRGDRH
jgi:hypothetical protein